MACQAGSWAFGGMDGQVNEQTENLTILLGPLPNNLPILQDKRNKEEETIAKRYHMVSITIAPLYTGFHL